MSNLARLREKALAHAAQATVRYPVCLNAERRDELQAIAQQIPLLAQQAAAALPVAEPLPEQADGTRKRRTIASKPVPVEARQQAAEQAIAPLKDRVAQLLAQAADEDDLVVVVFGVPEEGRDDPAAFYQAAMAKYENPTLSEKDLKRDLVNASYLRTEAPDGQDLGFDWETVHTKLLNHADLEQLGQPVLEIYREPSAIPFDPLTFGAPATS